MVKTEFENFPKELLNSVKSLHEKYEHWFPKWVQTVTYNYKIIKDDGEAVVAENYTSFPYRRVCINVFSNFLVAADEYREEVFVHEIFHTFSGLFTVPMFDIITKLIENEHFRDILLDELTEKVEGFTQDLTHSLLLHNKLAESKVKPLNKK